MIYNFLLIILAYLIGSFPSALVVGKIFKNVDIRNYGSKNLGSTNAIRILGFKLGILVFILDLIKPMIVLLLVKYNVFELNNLWHEAIFGLFSAIGHCFPIFAKFKGGKCAASSLGITICLSPLLALLGIIVFLLNFIINGYVCIGSTITGLAIVIGYLIQILINNTFTSYEITILIVYIILVLFIIIRHIPNYKRLIKGEEKSFKRKKQ